MTGSDRTGTRMRAAAVVLAVIAVAGATTGAVLRAAPGSEAGGSARLEAVFADASPLRAGNEIKMYGVRVGLIDEVALDPPGPDGQRRARVVADLEPGTEPLRADATAAIRPVSLLGERFLDVTPGSPGAPVLPAPAVIGPDRTSRAVDVDDLLNTFDDPTAAALASTTTGLGEGMRGRGPQIAAALDAVAPALRRADALSGILDQQNAVLTRLVDQGSRVSSSLADRDGATLDELVTTTRRTLDAVAANREALDRTLREAPTTVAAVRRTLAELAGTADATTPVLRSLRPLTGDLSDVSTELRAFADAADPALGSLPPVIDRLDALLDQARPLLSDLGPATDDLRRVAGAARPLGETLLVHRRGVPSNLEAAMNGIGDWAMATNGYDGTSHYFRGVAVVTPTTLANIACNVSPPPLPSPLPCPAPGPAAPAAPPAPAAARAPAGLPPVGVPPLGAVSDNATGLTPAQEQGLVGQMLGGR